MSPTAWAPPAETLIAEADRQWLAELLLKRSANALPEGQDHVLSWRLKQVAWRRNLLGLEELLRALRAGGDAGLEADVLAQLLDTDSWFFREPAVFGAIHAQVLPELLRTRGTRRSLAFWVPGCGQGQEVHSLVLTVRHHFPAMQDWDLRVLGTDILEEALLRAGQGAYDDNDVARGLPMALLARHFKRQPQRWVLAPELLAQSAFRRSNLADGFDPGLGDFDLVLLRNVVAAFDPDQRRPALDNAAHHVSRGGFLLLGEAELRAGLLPDPRVFKDLGGGLHRSYGQG